MPNATLLECFESPAATAFIIEHIHEEFTSMCPKTGHPDFGRITVRFEPAQKCIELKSLKLYLHSFRNEGMFFEALTNRIRDDLVAAMAPRWLQVVAEFRGRGGIHTRVLTGSGSVPERYQRG